MGRVRNRNQGAGPRSMTEVLKYSPRGNSLGYSRETQLLERLPQVPLT